MAAAALAGHFSIGNFTQVKLEYQYSDYLDYEYPSAILFEYPNQDYRQPAPYIADFPENRVLAKVSQGLGINDVLHVKYQFSDLDQAKWQQLFNAKYVRNLSSSTEAHLAGQFTTGSGNFTGKMVEIGGKVDWAGFILGEITYGFYRSEIDTAGSIQSDAHALELKLRQALSRSTALQVKYGYFFSGGESADFFSNTLTVWLSQFLPTQTALHLEWREHWNGSQYRAWSPGLEIDQYLGWATNLTLRVRYYRGLPRDPNQLAQITGRYFESNSFSIILAHHIFAETVINVKFRNYASDEGILMNTYLIGLEHIL
jgi:hypothetical protein